MRATIEKSLYIGILRTRFDIYDDVRLKLVDGEIIEGTIVDFEEESFVWIDNQDGRKRIRVDEIEDYVN